MKRIDIKTGFQCNNCCKFCIQGNKRFLKEDKTTREIEQILEQNCKNFDGVVFTGGEVTIRKDIFEIVYFAKKCGYKQIQIQTNGRMFFYMDFCKRLIDAGANEFALAIHGSTNELHDKLTRSKGSFRQTLQGIYNLNKFKQKVITNTVVTEINYKDLASIAKMLIDAGVFQYQFAFMHINPIIQNDEKLIEEIVPRYKEIKPYVEQGIQLGLDSNVRVMAEAFPFCTLNEKYYNCISENYIPETIIIEDNEAKDFKQIKKNWAKIKEKKCKDCKFYERCEGPWREYAEIFGFKEFIPIKNKI